MIKRYLILGIFFALIASYGLWSLNRNSSFQASEQVVLKSQNIVTINKQTFNVDVAETDEQKAAGLSGRPQLARNQGMLFVFKPAEQPKFWMKDMLFNLDLIWIKDQKVVAVTRNAPAPKAGTKLDNLPTYGAPTEIDYVLEVTAGFADQIKPGDSFTLGQTNAL